MVDEVADGARGLVVLPWEDPVGGLLVGRVRAEEVELRPERAGSSAWARGLRVPVATEPFVPAALAASVGCRRLWPMSRERVRSSVCEFGARL